MKNGKKAITALILIIAIILAVVLVFRFGTASSISDKADATAEKYSNYTKKSNSDIDLNNIIYHIDYLDFDNQKDKYSLDVDKDGKYSLTYSKYVTQDSTRAKNYYFDGDLSESDFDYVKEIFAQMDRYLEGVKRDYNNYEFYYSYEDVREQNENGNKLLKAILTEFINHIVYNEDGKRVSNFSEIVSILGNYSQNPELDLDAELVLNEKGIVQQVQKAQFGESDGANETSNDAVNNDSGEKATSGKNSSLSTIPLVTGEKSSDARKDRIVIDFVDSATDEEIVSVVGKLNSGFLFRYKDGNKFIITVSNCETEEQVTEVCNKINNEYSIVEKAELCYE